MDVQVLEFIKAVFAAEVFETIKATKAYKDEKLFRHTIREQRDLLIFCAMFPKAEVLRIPGLTEEFKASLSTFNLLGVVTDGEDALDMTVLGGQGKPFTRLASAQDLARLISDQNLQMFLESAYAAMGMKKPLSEVVPGEEMEMLAAAITGEELDLSALK